jgi:SAM-dependent methyltransferase
MPAGCQLVIDLGAGTGALTRLLLARGMNVVAVDPHPEMLRTLVRAYPGAGAVQGIGEDLPVATGSVDAVVVSSAWHWMRPDATTRETERVLRPGGVFGIVYNRRDRTVPWLADIEQFLRTLPLVRDFQTASPPRNPGAAAASARERSGRLPEPMPGTAFTPPQTTQVHWSALMTPGEVVGFFTSYDGVLCLPPQLRHELAVQLSRYISGHPVLGGRERIDLPMISTCWRVQRRRSGRS